LDWLTKIMPSCLVRFEERLEALSDIQKYQ
jgi:hypothetical protein